MSAQLFPTVDTAKIFIRIFRKPLGMSVECYFPSDQERNGQYQQTPRVTPPDKKQRSKHHRIIPVVNTAAPAAFVFHQPALEGAEKQDTDQIADRIGTAEKDHDPVIDNIVHPKRTYDPVKDDPDQCHKNDGVIILDHNMRVSGFDIIPSELFLGSGSSRG